MHARAWRRPAATAAIVLLALALGAVLFDWNWLRGPIERHLAKTSRRVVRVGELSVEHVLSLSPTVRLKRVYVENAAWAISKKPLVDAAEIAFTLPLSGLFGGDIVVNKIVLTDARIDMERTRDGLRNWRLDEPENRAPGRVRVRTLEAHGSQISFANGEIDLAFEATIDAAPAPASATLPSLITYKGRYRGRSFEGEALTGAVISFRDSEYGFPLRGHFVATGTRLDFDGTAADIFEPGAIDVQARLAGPTLSDVYPFLRIHPPQSRPYALQTRLTHRDGVFHLQNVTGHLGNTRGTAEVTWDRSRERRRLDAVLRSDAAAFEDVSPLIGLASTGTGSRSLGDLAGGKGSREGGHGKPLPLGALRSIDARVVATAKRLTIGGLPPLADAHVEGTLNDGSMEVKPIAFHVAGGQGSATFKLDVREPAALATLDGELRSVRIEQLVPSLARDDRAAAVVSGALKLEGRGRSTTEIVRDARGAIDAHIDSGRLSKKWDAKLGLDYGKLVKTFIVGDRDIAIRCGRLALDVRDGIGRTRSLALDTGDTHVAGRGTISFREQRLDLVLDPQPRDPSLFAKRRSIKVAGTFGSPRVSLGDAVQIEGGC